MSLSIRILFIFIGISLVSTPGWSQENSKKGVAQPAMEESEDKEEPSRSAGLRKIAGGSSEEVDIDIHIDEEALESNIEMAVENAMEVVDVVLENLVIDIDPIEIDIPDFDINIDPVHIDMDDFDMDMDMDVDVDMDMDHDDFDWDDD